ncbi:hypothetical protein GCM10009119_10740 [Algoriphagus jejuensis]|uniref:Uncharacterized protein n=1 Tax=Algoriphagus jejuensis TaxID=419934 RepID=A0ABP3YBZ5_9BACT
MPQLNSILLLLFFALLGCVEDDDKRFTPTCAAGDTREIYAGTGILNYTDFISGQQGSDYHFVISNHNIEGVMLPLVVCNPVDFKILQPDIDNLEVSFQGIVEILPETIDAGSTIIQIETIQAR